MAPLELRPLAPALLEDWLAFFDGDAFADNPDWGGCYCRCFLFGGGGYEAFDRACEERVNRGAMIERIRAGEVDGLLAYRDGRVVGWVHYGPTARFHTPLAPLAPADEGVASIVCFVVAGPHRRTGVARALLRGACERLAGAGYRAVDGRARAGEHSDADHFTGPLALFLSEGFRVAAPEDERQRVRVRREL